MGQRRLVAGGFVSGRGRGPGCRSVEQFRKPVSNRFCKFCLITRARIDVGDRAGGASRDGFKPQADFSSKRPADITSLQRGLANGQMQLSSSAACSRQGVQGAVFRSFGRKIDRSALDACSRCHTPRLPHEIERLEPELRCGLMQGEEPGSTQLCRRSLRTCAGPALSCTSGQMKKTATDSSKAAKSGFGFMPWPPAK